MHFQFAGATAVRKQAGALVRPWTGLCRDTRMQQAPQPALPQTRACQDLSWKAPLQTRALPVWAHQLLAGSAGTPGTSSPAAAAACPDRGSRACPGLPAAPREGWALVALRSQPDLLRAPGCVQRTQSCPGLSWKG